MSTERFDAVVVGSGPNGLSAAVRLAEAGRSVLVIEAAEVLGGGTRSAELTLPGYVHDVCAAVHALGVSAPPLSLDTLGQHGLRWVRPDIPLAHPLGPGDRYHALPRRWFLLPSPTGESAENCIVDGVAAAHNEST